LNLVERNIIAELSIEEKNLINDIKGLGYIAGGYAKSLIYPADTPAGISQDIDIFSYSEESFNCLYSKFADKITRETSFSVGFDMPMNDGNIKPVQIIKPIFANDEIGSLARFDLTNCEAYIKDISTICISEEADYFNTLAVLNLKIADRDDIIDSIHRLNKYTKRGFYIQYDNLIEVLSAKEVEPTNNNAIFVGIITSTSFDVFCLDLASSSNYNSDINVSSLHFDYFNNGIRIISEFYLTEGTVEQFSDAVNKKYPSLSFYANPDNKGINDISFLSPGETLCDMCRYLQNTIDDVTIACDWTCELLTPRTICKDFRYPNYN
jgi:hypothetical protein